MNQKCGLRVKSNTLEPNRETVVVSMVERGPYGRIEDWKGCIEIEITPRCILREDIQNLVAEQLAQDEMPDSLRVDEWAIQRTGNVIQLTPKEWEEDDAC